MENVKAMPFDAVHDTQAVYRALLDAMAFPGTVQEIGPAAGKLDPALAGCPAAAAIALTLLDGEVRHAVRMTGTAALSDYIRRMTFSPPAPVEQADYVFADGDMDGEQIRSLFEDLKRGTHESPELSATLLIRVQDMGEQGEGKWVLSGPGIAKEAACGISGLDPVWFSERKKANAEYPVGIDMILFTEDGKVLALPRTTKIREEERAWHT